MQAVCTRAHYNYSAHDLRIIEIIIFFNIVIRYNLIIIIFKHNMPARATRIGNLN